jgi:PAS domain S-box-containing protein
MEAGLRVSAGAFFISDPHQPTFPIVYASKSFLNLTGYARADVLGQNCSFLQGPGVDTADVRTLADSYDGCTPCDVLSVDLKKNGDKFWNFMHLEPTPHGLGGKSTLVVHAQSDVSAYVEAVAIYGGAHAAQHMPSVRPTGSSCDDEFDEFTSSGDDLSADALPAGDPHQMARFDPLRHIVDDTGENFHGGSPALAVDVTTMMEFVDDCLVQVPDPHSDPWFQTPEDHNEWTIPVASSGIF